MVDMVQHELCLPTSPVFSQTAPPHSGGPGPPPPLRPMYPTFPLPGTAYLSLLIQLIPSYSSDLTLDKFPWRGLIKSSSSSNSLYSFWHLSQLVLHFFKFLLFVSQLERKSWRTGTTSTLGSLSSVLQS